MPLDTFSFSTRFSHQKFDRSFKRWHGTHFHRMITIYVEPFEWAYLPHWWDAIIWDDLVSDFKNSLADQGIINLDGGGESWSAGQNGDDHHSLEPGNSRVRKIVLIVQEWGWGSDCHIEWGFIVSLWNTTVLKGSPKKGKNSQVRVLKGCSGKSQIIWRYKTDPDSCFSSSQSWNNREWLGKLIEKPYVPVQGDGHKGPPGAIERL